ncbi:amino acid adenylation domain-containing protein [bacterium]|nr:amino acid adenylation domain-containing protein [bacterium]
MITPIAELLFDQKFPEDCAFKYLNLGGDTLRKLPPVDFKPQVINVYGPTECACITVEDIFPHGYQGPITIGKPIFNTRVYILNDKLEEVESGELGELCLAGDSVGNGYWKLPEQTEHAFVKGKDVNERLGEEVIYRTGDLVCEMADGRIDFRGRIDFQVKIRGLRIELNEIEKVIHNHQNIDQAVVLAIGEGNEKFLVTYYTSKDKQKIDQDEIINYCQQELPDYMVPQFYLHLDKIPVTSNLKVDRKALESMELPKEDKAIISPENELQSEILSIWQDYLKLKKISIDDNFYYIGGHSLKAAQIVNELQSRAYDIELAQFMTNPTIKELSEIILKTELTTDNIQIIARNKEYYRITKNQEDLWYLSHLDDSHRVYNIVMKCEFIDNINEKTLLSSLDLLVKHYESFRSSYKEVNKSIYQFIEAEHSLNCELVSITSPSELEDLITQIQEIKLSPHNYPLYTMKLINFNDELLLLMNIHHLIFDGWSMQVFIDKLSEIYHKLSSPSESGMEFSPIIQNIDYAEWLRNKNDQFELDHNYWHHVLTPYAPDLFLNINRFKHNYLSPNGDRVWFHIDKNRLAKISNFAQQHSVSLFSLCLTLYQLVLAKKSKRSDISVAFPYAGRKSKEEEKLIGYYTNMVIVRTKMFNTDFAKLLSMVHKQVMEAITHSSKPFGDVIKSFNLPLDKSKPPLYQAIFVMQNWHGTASHSIIKSEKELGSKTSKTDLILNAEEIESGMEFWLEYNTDFYQRDLIEELKNDFLGLLDSLAAPTITSNYKTCFILTETTLGIQCAEILLAQDYHIYGIITPNDQVAKWASQQGIYSANLSKTELKQLLVKYPYEYLFSIVNSLVLDKEILATPIKMAINYHDSLLPKYAGLYATFWAIYHDETRHGITWHQVDEGIDTGKILAQSEVSIETNDTSSLLNMKCYEAAIKSFTQVINSLEDKQLDLIQQDLSQRSYYSLDYRTEDCCSITSNSQLASCERLSRATDFGDNDNPVANLQVKINDDFYLIEKAEFVKINNKVGNNLEVIQDKLEIYLTDGKIICNQLLDLYGQALEIESLASHKIWQSPNQSDLQVYSQGVKNEQYWLKQVADYEPLELPVNHEKVTKHNPNLSLENPDLPLFISFLARLSSHSKFSLVIDLKESHPLLMNKLPLNIKIDFNLTLQENIAKIEKSLKILKKRSYLLKTVFYRYPQLSHYKHVLTNFESILAEDLFTTFKSNYQGNQLLKDVLLINQADLTKIESWNSKTYHLPNNKSYIDLFKETVQIFPANIAVEFDNQTLTYQELDILSDNLASYLYNEYGRDQFIAISTERCIEMIVIILGIIKSGNAYLPIDPDYPSERIKHILENSQTKLLFSDYNYLDIKGLNTLSVSNYRQYKSTKQTSISLAQSDLVYIIYTSGTTGKPKGVMVNQGNLINHNLIVKERYDLTPQDRVLQFASISFDISVEEIFPCLISGASLVLRSNEINKSASQFLDFIRTKEITIVNLPTAFWHQIVKSLPQELFSDLVKTLVIGGEKASSEIYQHWLEYGPQDTKLFNTYGPTEATIIATIDQGIDDTIGKTMPNTAIHILDRFLKPMPIGFAGSIYIGGKGVSPGYYHNEKLTSEKFIETSDYGRIYATGDLGLFYETGKIKFLGRDDDQIKLNGYRIELSEIENSITQNSSLKTVFADVRGPENNKKIYLYYLSNSDISRDYFTNLTKQFLPDYMIPSEYIRITELPLNPNGKITKKLLPAPEVKETHVNLQAYNLYELKILPLFRDVLGKEIGFEDNFFKEGGDSLKAIELIVSLENALNMKINSSSLYQHSTVRELSRYLQDEKQADFSIVTPLQTGDSNYKPLFLTHTTPGDVLGYVNLIHALDNKIPVYGIQSQGLSSEECQTCFLEMVKKYTDEILKIQQQGPFHIGGWCYGGILAFEIGVELKKRGHQDIQLYLIETWGRPNTKFRKISYQLRRLFNAVILGPKFWRSYLNTKLSNFSNIHKVLEEDFIENITETLGGKSQAEIDKLKNIYRYNIDALNKHTMSNFPDEINLFLAEEPLEGLIPDPKYGWSGMVSKINYYSVKGSHTTVLKHPFVEDIPGVISNILLSSRGAKPL